MVSDNSCSSFLRNHRPRSKYVCYIDFNELIKKSFGLRDVAQLGSAPALGAGCRRFKSYHPDFFKRTNK